MKALLFCLLFGVSAAAAQAPLGKFLSQRYPSLRDADQSLVLITFRDKGISKLENFRNPQSLLSERSVRRRLKVRDASRVIDAQDLPLDAAYVRAVASRVATVRHQLKWFNGVSVMATKAQIDEVRKLPFVAEVELLGRWATRPGDEQPEPLKNSPSTRAPSGTTTLDYGTSFTQDNLINIPAVHNLGFYGQGVVIGVFDNGFRNLAHQAFDSIHIIATYDFVDHKVGVAPNNPSTAFGSHGVWTLSTIGGYSPGNLIGPAFKADYILARTENDSSETPIEEDNWAAAIQWADSIGVDVTSTSLGYTTFDAPYTSLTWQDMNGHTALITNAADRAVGLGIVVVNSAGNSGFNPSQNTLVTPADGDSVIAAGALTSTGARSSFSSVGPTTDVPPRIKPDVMAMGSGVKAASATDTISYVSVSGTSFACPLTAGVAALILSANPSLTPMEVRDAMRQTASNVCSPNNLVGWGTLNALSAVKFSSWASVGSISGTVFDDLNGSGFKDAGEPGLAGVKVKLTCTVVESTLTDGTGAYTFPNLPSGPYTVTEPRPAGWIGTAPPSGLYSVTLDSVNTTVTGRDFGTFHTATVRGTKFNDVNRNGIRDSGDVILADWVIKVSGSEFHRATTDTAGNYVITGIGPGTFSVQETTMTYWFQTLPGGNGMYSITTRSGLDTTMLDFGNYYNPPNGYPVYASWNLLSLPTDPSDHSKMAIYPTAVSRAFSFESSSGYSVVDPIPNGVGYWLKFAGPEFIPIPGHTRTSDSVVINPGWNLIGSLTFQVAISSILQSPGGIISSPYFSYHGSYTLDDSLRPHFGYFVKASGPGKIYLNTSPAAFTGNAGSRNFESIKHDLEETASTITLHDSRGRQQVLYFGFAKVLSENRGAFDLPPLPPDDAFDARFSDGSLAWAPRAGDPAERASIDLLSDAFPLEISWHIVSGDGEYSLAEGNSSRKTDLLPGGHLTVRDPATKVLRLMGTSQAGQHALPREYGLGQNYPNPFNPSTLIDYQIPADGNVRLEVFNLIGQRVRLLVDGAERAGVYTAEWDGRSTEGVDLAGGIYLVKLTVSSAGKQVFTSTKKTVLMR
jgi:subtilisin family serine protease